MDAARAQRLLKIHPGEGRAVGLAVAMSFVVSAGLMIGQSGIEAVFFARFGVERLPGMYLVLGGTMFLLTLGFGALVTRLGRGSACIVVPIAIAVLAAAGRAGLASGLSWVPQALWVLQGAGYFLLGLTVWGLAGIVSDTRQAKRFFPLIGAGGVLGYVLGGLVTKPLASWIGTPNLVLVWVGTMVVATALGARLLTGTGERGGARRARDRRDTRPRRERRSADPIEQLVVGLRSVRRSAMMRWLAAASILFSLLFFSLYLPFSRAATGRFPQADDLAGFFGVFFGLSTGAAFLLSLFVTNRLLARFGVPTVMLVLPVLYVVAFGVLTVDDGFAALAIFRFAQVAWLQGVASSAWEAVINTVPADRRDQTRAFLYGGPTQVGTVLAGVVALIGERALSPTTLYGIGLASAVLATLAMIGVRRAYPRELVRALREGRPSVFDETASEAAAYPFGLTHADPSMVPLAVGALSDPDPRLRRVATHVLGDLDAAEATDSLVTCLHDEDAEVRATAIASLTRSGARAEVARILERSTDPEPAVRLATIDAIDALGMQREAVSHAVGPLVHDPDPFVRARAAALLTRLTADPTGPSTLAALADDEDELVRASAFGAMRGLEAPALFEIARGGLDDPVPAVRAEAARALASIDRERAVDALLPRLADDHRLVRESTADGLAEIGASVVHEIVGSLELPERRDGALTTLERLSIAGVSLDGRADDLHRFALRCSAEAVEGHVLAAALERTHDDATAMLVDSLLDRSDREARMALRAAALLDGAPEIAVALENLSVTDPAQRANAIEVIDSVGRRDVVRPLLTMWDGTAPRTDVPQAIERLLTDPDPWIRACAELAHAGATAGANPRPRAGGTMSETLTTLSPMERVLFLRKVPLFASLPPPDLQPIATIAVEQAFDDGETIASQGEIGDEMHIIVSGEIAVVATGDGRDRVLAVRTAGDAVGEMSVLTNEPRVADLIARGPVRLLSIERRRFESILQERPETSLGVIRVLCARLAEAPAAQTRATRDGAQAGDAAEEGEP